MKENGLKLTNFIVLSVFCMFAVCVMLVLLTGADVYKRLLDRGQSMYDYRTAAGYVTTRIRQSDRAKSVSVELFDGESALVFREVIAGEFYETKIYAHDGYIRELFAVSESACLPGDGEKILPVQLLIFTGNDDWLEVMIRTEDGREQKLLFYLRSGEEHNDEE